MDKNIWRDSKMVFRHFTPSNDFFSSLNLKNIDEKKPTKKDNLSKQMKDFSENTSCHGVKRILNNKTPNNCLRWKNVLWLLLTMVSLGMACHSVVKIITDYSSYPVTTLLKDEFMKNGDFPSVSICNLNLAVPDRLKEIRWDFYKRFGRRNEQTGRFSWMEMLKSEFSFMTIEEQQSIGHVLDEMLIECVFGKRPCSADDFFWYPDYNYGNCYTFNFGIRQNGSLDEIRPLRQTGRDSGLTLTLDIQSDLYFSSTEEVGAIVMIHKARESPEQQERGIVVAPGFSSIIALDTEEIIGVEPPYGRCLSKDDEGNKELNMFASLGYRYGREICVKSCKQANVIQKCGCCEMSVPCNPEGLKEMFGIPLPPPGTVPQCNMTDYKILDCLDDIRGSMNGQSDCFRMCPLQCLFVNYHVSKSVSLWPSRGGDLFARINGYSRLPNATKDERYAFVRENVLKINIHFHSQQKRQIITQPTYSWSVLLSNLGGQLGLWLGFSVLTGFEFLEMLMDLVLVGIKTTWRFIRIHVTASSSVKK